MRAASLAALALLPGLVGCVVVPATREFYDPECRMMRREVTLEAGAIGHIASCQGNECAALLATYGVVAAASVVVSGSIAIVGNVVYWFEHEAHCRRANAAPDADAPASAPAGAAPFAATQRAPLPPSSTSSAPAPP